MYVQQQLFCYYVCTLSVVMYMKLATVMFRVSLLCSYVRICKSMYVCAVVNHFVHTTQGSSEAPLLLSTYECTVYK